MLRKDSVWVIALACLCLWAAQAHAQRQWIRFDGGVAKSPGLEFTLSRPTSVYGYDGRLLSADQPRFLSPTLFCGPMDSESVLAGVNINAIGAGYDTDGRTPVWVIRYASQSQLTVHTGVDSVERAYRDGNWNGAYRLTTKDLSKQGASDLLVGQTGLNGGTPSQPNFAFSPDGCASVHNGLIVINCEVLEFDGANFVSSRIGLVYTTTERLREPDPWIVAALGEPTNRLDRTRDQLWAASQFPVGPDEMIVAWADYRHPRKTGGVCYATRFLRAAGEWTCESIRIARNDTPFLTEHFHTGGYIRHPDGRQTLFASTGDGVGDNRLMATTLSVGGVWRSPDPVPDTGVDPRSTIYFPSADWTPTQNVWGGSGDTPALRHNQAICMRAADPDFSALLCAADETDATVLRMTYDPDTRLPAWTTLALPAITSAAGDGVINYTIEGMPGGPYLSRIDAAEVRPWHSANRETRILFSPDGVDWGQCFVPLTTSGRLAVFMGNTAYLGGAETEPFGLRRLTMPQYRLVRPLALAPTTDNMLRDAVPIPTQKRDAGALITHLAGPQELPPGVPPPPCDPSNMFRIQNSADKGRLGVWYPVSSAADVPVPTQSVLVRAWLWALNPKSAQDPATTAQIAANLYDASDVTRLNVYTGRRDFDSGQWNPVTIWTGATGFQPGGTWKPAVYLSDEPWGAAYVRNDFLIAWEGFFQDAPTVEGNGLPPGQIGASEDATVQGFALPEEWSLFLTGMVPFDQWDNRVGGGPNLTDCPATPTLFTIDGAVGTTQLRLQADPPNEGLTISLTTDQGSSDVSESNQIYWLRGSPVLCLLRGRAGETVMDYSVGGSTPRRLILPGGITPSAVHLGPDAMLWHSIESLAYAVPDTETEYILRALSLRCRADFNSDDAVNSMDVLAFLNAWVSGDDCTDFNHDGTVNTADVLAFLNAFAQGC